MHCGSKNLNIGENDNSKSALNYVGERGGYLKRILTYIKKGRKSIQHMELIKGDRKSEEILHKFGAHQD